jgi:hypothetical protein
MEKVIMQINRKYKLDKVEEIKRSANEDNLFDMILGSIALIGSIVMLGIIIIMLR